MLLICSLGSASLKEYWGKFLNITVCLPLVKLDDFNQTNTNIGLTQRMSETGHLLKIDAFRVFFGGMCGDGSAQDWKHIYWRERLDSDSPINNNF